METAKLFKNGRSQAVRLPKRFSLPGGEVYIINKKPLSTVNRIRSKHPDEVSIFTISIAEL